MLVVESVVCVVWYHVSDSVIGAESLEWQGLALSMNPMSKANGDLLITTFASVENSTPFVCTS